MIEDLKISDETIWNVERIGKNFYKITLKADNMVMTGANVYAYITIHGLHRLVRLELKHTDANNADATDSWSYMFYKYLPKFGIYNLLAWRERMTQANVYIVFGEGYEMGTQRYMLEADCETNLHKVFIELYVQKLD